MNGSSEGTATSPVAVCRRAAATGCDATLLAADLADQIGAGPHALAVAFVSPEVDRAGFAAVWQQRLAGTLAVGCSSAGEIGPDGFHAGGAVAFALPNDGFRAVHHLFPDVRTLGVASIHTVVQELLVRMAATGPAAHPGNTFALLLIDGLSMAEEWLASALAAALGKIPLVGGSAGDGLAFGTTHVFADGEAHARGALLLLVQTDHPFVVWKTEAFVSGDQRMVVTSADCPRRVVHEIDAEPATVAFARVHGLDATALDPVAFATHPVVVRIAGGEYVRSIQKAGGDGSLTFFCAIEEGIVLRDARCVGLVANLREAIDSIERQVGAPDLTIGFDCILRRLECERLGLVDEVSGLLRRTRCLGFSTYGEQVHGMHVNQTLTAVSIGRRSSP